MDRFRRYGNLLKSDGTNQLQRTLPALEPGYVLPDERSLSDLVDYARRLAAELRYYNASGQATGDWRAFLEPLLDPATGAALPTPALEAEITARRDWPPHVALFLSFLELFRHLQDDMNELPVRHLRHYYEQVLHLERRRASADEVHVVFELARNVPPTALPAGTGLDAGKDEAEGRALTYETTSELVVSSARVADIRRLVSEVDRRGRRRFFAAAALAQSEAESWHTFGRRQLDLDASLRFMQEARMGFAIASPLLRMAEGTRTVEISASLRAADGVLPPAQSLGFAAVLELTGEEGWVMPESFDIQLVDHGPSAPMTLEINLTLGEGAPSIVPHDASLHGDGPVSPWPAVRCLLRGEAGHYETLDGLVVEQATLSVAVTGVRDLVLHNDQGPLTAGQPMALFGTQPRIGSQFFVGSAEVFANRLSSLTLNLQWQDLPEDLLEHYRTYFDFTDDVDFEDEFAGNFIVDAHLLYERSFDHRILENQSLLGFPDPAMRSMFAGPSAFESAFAGTTYRAQPDLHQLGRFGPSTKHGFLRLTLTDPSYGPPYSNLVPFEAFGHQAFSRRYAAQAIALSRWDGTGTPPELPNEPYTPMLGALSLDYTATVDMVPGDVHAEEALFVVGPWGHTEARDDVPARLVPEFDGDAALFLGVEDLEPPANLSLLFQIDSGTAASAEVLASGETEWSYLRGGAWEILPREAVLNDSTLGFQQPGLVVVSVGGEASIEHHTMPSGLVWLRALIRRPAESASRTLALHAQATLATFTPEVGELDDYAEHLESGLAAESIKRLKKRDAAIKRVTQPYASTGGRGSEHDDGFFRRCSERLRHRNRAVTAWDFERLVLESFPEVFKVKCLPHSDADGMAKPGEAALVVVPDLRATQSTNPLEPRAGAVLMGRIEAYLAEGLASPFATMHVIHPVYERIRVDIRVAFHPGLDAGFYANVLNEDLRRFLSPWAYEEGQDILFGARIYKSEILAFLEGREYVDFVTDFNLYHSHDGPPQGGIGQMEIGADFVIRPDPSPAILHMSIGDDFVVGRGVEVAQTTRPHAILVSHPEHRITPLEAGEDRCTGVSQLGIGFMTVGLDFDVHAA